MSGFACSSEPDELAHPEQLDRAGIPGDRALAKRLVLGPLQGRIGPDESDGEFASTCEQILVGGQPRVAHFESTCLTGSDQITHPAFLQVQLRDPEAVLGGGERA